MSTWKQEVADEITPIEGVNDVKATLVWNIAIAGDAYSPLPDSGSIVQITRTVQVKGLREIAKNLIDGKNYIAGDFSTEIAYTKYLAARAPLASDPVIPGDGKSLTLSDVRPLAENYGIRPVEDTLSIGGTVWNICNVLAIGLMNDEVTGNPVPAKLRLILRK